MNEKKLRALIKRHGGAVERSMMTNRLADGRGAGIVNRVWFTKDGAWWIPRHLIDLDEDEPTSGG